jgi:hypothetical protein
MLLSSTLTYLESPEAWASSKRDPYWPKWDSPWWHLLLLHELGETDSPVAREAARTLLESIRDHFLPAFFPEELPEGKSPDRHVGCFCALGTIFPALESFGLDPEAALPWAREWMMKHVLPDGGLNCDEGRCRREKPGSSIVATVAALEFLVESRSGPRNEAETDFAHGLARDLLDRELRLGRWDGSNSEEKEDETDWRELCFPRFYFYDVLRGLTAITRYSERLKAPISAAAIADSVSAIEEKSLRGPLRIERDSVSGVRTLDFEKGDWVKPRPSRPFPLLRSVSRVGEESPALQAEWDSTRARIKRLRSIGLIG